MKKAGIKSPLKILAATSVTIFSLLSVFTSTAAWFDSQRNLKNGGSNFEVSSQNGVFNKLSVHDMVFTDNNQYQFNQDPIGTIEMVDWSTKEIRSTFSGGSPFEMGKYDYLEKSHPMLLLIEVGEGNSPVAVDATNPVVVKASTYIDYYLGDGRRTLYNQEQVENDEGINPLSSVLSFSSISFASTDALSAIEGTKTMETASGDITYNTFDVVKNTLGESKSFVQFDGEDYDEFESDINIFSARYGTSVKYIAIVFDYYEVAVETIYNTYLGDPALEEELYFSCDWTLVV